MSPAAFRQEYVLRLGDSALILAQRLGALVASAPTMEEDVAIANVALDLLGQARALLTYPGQLEGHARGEDELAYFRQAHDFRNLLLVEQPNGDFAQTQLRQFLYDAYAIELWRSLEGSADSLLAAVAGKAVKETTYHVRRSADWVIRLGDGTDESARRLRDAVSNLWMYTGELFLTDEVDEAMAAAGVAPLASGLEPAWRARVADVFAHARLAIPEDRWPQRGGKLGRHTEQLDYILAEMQVLPRTYPRGALVTSTVADAWSVLAEVPDPEIPVVSVVDLGIVREVTVSEDRVTVTLTPTYTGCPATLPIQQDVAAALREHFQQVDVRVSLAPAWTTDWITTQGRQRLQAYGIAPPNPATNRPKRCPHCGSSNTEELSEFGSTPCKALHRCRACREPFDYFKCL